MMSPLRGRRLTVAVGVAILAVIGAFVVRVGSAAPVRNAGEYVALGDSYAAGPGIPVAAGVPVGCGRSSQDYPSLVFAGAHFSSFRDVSCGGATITDLTESQRTRVGGNPPQLNALTSEVSLVTLTIGGNDIGFNLIVSTCLARSRSQPTGAACQAYFAQNGHDVLAQRIASAAPKLLAVLRQVNQRAPQAKVLVVGYPAILPASGGGCSEAPFSAEDISYLNQVFRSLNAMLEAQADAAGDHYVDTATSSAGHDLCRAPGIRWVEGVAPDSPAAPFHPNALGMHNSAAQVLGARLLP
jgi:lysophospholipase L1-like esterase